MKGSLLFVALMAFIALYVGLVNFVEARASRKGIPQAKMFSALWFRMNMLFLLGIGVTITGGLIESLELIGAGLAVAFVGTLVTWRDRIRRAR
jgi:hypothetical protein